MRKPATLPLFVLVCLVFTSVLTGQEKEQEFYELRIYRNDSAEDKSVVNDYLKDALVPALHKQGLDRVGVFTRQDIVDDHSLYVLIPYTEIRDFTDLNRKLAEDSEYQSKAGIIHKRSMKDPAYQRIESRFMKAFKGMPVAELPPSSIDKSERMFEIRIYESHNDDTANRKVKMFNEGEIDLMKNVEMGPVFFAETLIGPDVPNLIYMLSANNSDDHKAHWGAFIKHPEWDRMKNLDRYKDTVSKITNWFVVPTEYSDI